MKKHVKQGLVVMLVLTMVGGLLLGMGVQKVKAASKKYMEVSNLKAGIGWVIERSNYLETNYSISKLSFTSSKKSVATVSSKGKITTKAKGKTTITIKNKSTKKKLKSFTVTVKTAGKNKDFGFRKFGVGVDWSELNLLYVAKKTDYYGLLFDMISFRNLKATYTVASDNTAVFTIDSNGKNFKALSAGQANLVVTEKYKGKKNTFSYTLDVIEPAIPEEELQQEIDLYTFSDWIHYYDENDEEQEKEFCNSGNSSVYCLPTNYGLSRYIMEVAGSIDELSDAVSEEDYPDADEEDNNYNINYHYTDHLSWYMSDGYPTFASIPLNNEDGKTATPGSTYVRFFGKMADGTYKNIGTITINVKDNSAEYNEYQEALKKYEESMNEEESENENE